MGGAHHIQLSSVYRNNNGAGFYNTDECRTVLNIDCAITPDLFTVKGVESLSALEPCGNGCPKPNLCMMGLTVDRISMVSSGRHMRLRLRWRHHLLGGIFFSATPETASIEPGDLVDVAFTPQINDFRGERTVQMNVLDIRPSCNAPCTPDATGYTGLKNGSICREDAEKLFPDRSTLATVWRYLAACAAPIREDPMCLCRKIVRRSGAPLSLGQLLTCLDIFRDVGLLSITRIHNSMVIELAPADTKADLNESRTMQILLKAKEG